VTTDRPKDPLAQTTRLIIDGKNLLHAITSRADRAPAAALIGRVRGVVPGHIAIDLVFDGPAETHLRGERIAAGIRVRYSGGRSADSLILTLADEVAAEGGPGATNEVLVVTDDRDLRHRLRIRGARSAGADWLIGRLERPRLAAASAGNPRPPRTPQQPGDDDPGWRPGRGATTKRGPSKRRPKSQRGSTEA
jgi:hypothetical protein